MGKQQQSKPSPCEPHCSSLQALRRMALAGYGLEDIEMAQSKRRLGLIG